MSTFNPVKTHKVGIVAKTDSTQTRVQIHEFEDRTILDIRQWYKKKGDDQFKPGKGASFPIDKAKRLKKMIAKAIKIAEDEGLLDEE